MGRLLNYIFNQKRKEFLAFEKERDRYYELPHDIVCVRNFGYDKHRSERWMDVYRPYDTSKKYPIIVNIHGGGLVMGSKEFNTYFCAQLARLGFIVFSIEYRLIPNTNIRGQIDDVSRAMDFVKETASLFDGDMSNVYIVGDGAGALLSVYALAIQKNRKFAKTINVRPSALGVNAAAFISGMFYTTRLDSVGLLMSNSIWGKGFRRRGIRRFTDPGYSGIARHLPPCYLISGENDAMLRNTRIFANSLCESDIAHEVCVFQDGESLLKAFPVVEPDLPESLQAMEDIAKFFNEYRKDGVK